MLRRQFVKTFGSIFAAPAALLAVAKAKPGDRRHGLSCEDCGAPAEFLAHDGDLVNGWVRLRPEDRHWFCAAHARSGRLRHSDGRVYAHNGCRPLREVIAVTGESFA